MPAETYSDHLDDLIAWLENTGQLMNADPASRPWCVLALPGIQVSDIKKYFDRTDVNAQYAAEYNLQTLTNNPVAYLQQDNDGLYALQKGFILRHQGRLAGYRDDCEQKDVRVYNALGMAKARLQHYKDIA